MRKFNDSEKFIIRELVDYYKVENNNLNTISRFLNDKILGEDLKLVIRDDGNYITYFKSGNSQKSLFKVVEVFYLFRELIDSHLIFTMPGDFKGILFIGVNENVYGGENEENKMILFANGEYIGKDLFWYDKNDNLRYEFFTMTEEHFQIKDFISSVPVISPNIEELLKNNFRTIEERTLSTTQCAAIVSFLGLLVALILPFVTQTKIHKTQHEEFVQSVNNTKMEISISSNEIIGKIDTLTDVLQELKLSKISETKLIGKIDSLTDVLQEKKLSKMMENKNNSVK